MRAYLRCPTSGLTFGRLRWTYVRPAVGWTYVQMLPEAGRPRPVGRGPQSAFSSLLPGTPGRSRREACPGPEVRCVHGPPCGRAARSGRARSARSGRADSAVPCTARSGCRDARATREPTPSARCVAHCPCLPSGTSVPVASAASVARLAPLGISPDRRRRPASPSRLIPPGPPSGSPGVVPVPEMPGGVPRWYSVGRESLVRWQDLPGSLRGLTAWAGEGASEPPTPSPSPL